jgi:exodeoxyribonuclease X
MLLRVIDIETTGMEPPAEIIEFGRADVVSEGTSWRIDRPMARLYKPLRGIPPETMAVHHITETEFAADTPECTQDLLHKAIWGGNGPDVLVAHN